MRWYQRLFSRFGWMPGARVHPNSGLGLIYRDYECNRKLWRENSIFIDNIYNKISNDVALSKFRHIKISEIKNAPDEMNWLEHSDISYVLNRRPNDLETPTAFWNRVVRKMLKEDFCIVIPNYKSGKLDSLEVAENVAYYDKEYIYILPEDENWFRNYLGPRRFVNPDLWEPGENYSIQDDDWYWFDEESRKYYIRYKVKDVLIFENPRPGLTSNLNALTNLINLGLERLMEKLSDNAGLKALLKTHTTAVDDNLKRRAETRVRNIMEVAENGGIGFLQIGEEFQELSNNYNTAEESEVNLLKNQLANAYGLNDDLINCNYTEMQYRAYQQSIITPFMNTIKEELNYKLITKTAYTQGQRILMYFDLYNITSLKDMSDFAQKMKYNAIMSSNEIREIFGYGGYVGGDVYETNANAVPTSEISSQIIEPTSVEEIIYEGVNNNDGN